MTGNVKLDRTETQFYLLTPLRYTLYVFSTLSTMRRARQQLERSVIGKN
jgi:hypothetical protein